MTASPNSGFAIRVEGSLRGSHSKSVLMRSLALALQTPFSPVPLSVNFAIKWMTDTLILISSYLACSIIATCNIMFSKLLEDPTPCLPFSRLLAPLAARLVRLANFASGVESLFFHSFCSSVRLFGELLNFTSTGGDFFHPSLQSSALHLDVIMHTDWQDRAIILPQSSFKEGNIKKYTERNVRGL